VSAHAFYGVGAWAPGGLDARQVALSARAAKFAPRPFDIGTRVEPHRVGTARLRSLPDDLVGVDRLVALAVGALRELVISARLDPNVKLTAFIAGPGPRAWPEAEDARVHGSWLADVFHRAGLALDVQGSDVLRVGQPGFAVALERARSRDGLTIVGGVDTFHHRDVLANLAKNKLLLDDDAHGGFVPSEGACMFLVGPGDDKERRPLAVLKEVAYGKELPKTWEQPRVAELLTALVERVGGALSSKPARWLLTDLNNERWRTKERDYLFFRARSVLTQETLETRLGTELGELGAAFGALMTNQAIQGFETGFAPAEEALVLASASDMRAAWIVGEPQHG
jgi:hypothetical protein